MKNVCKVLPKRVKTFWENLWCDLHEKSHFAYNKTEIKWEPLKSNLQYKLHKLINIDLIGVLKQYLSAWLCATMPVGRCTILTALSVLLACWPPGPPEQNVSTLKSDSFSVTCATDSRIGITATAANDVCLRLLLSKGEILTSLCTPASHFAYPKAYSPSNRIVAL